MDMDEGMSFWLPTGILEIGVIVLFISVFVITMILFHYGEVQRKVSKSRCALQTTSALTGIYTISAVNANNSKLYHVDYNLDTKSFDVECDCTEGNIINNFNNISIYNLRKQAPTTINKLCNCDNSYDSLTGETYYNGDNGLIRFMNSGDTSFFTDTKS
jgi:hypothetical protein